jgi:hypothetical protein
MSMNPVDKLLSRVPKDFFEDEIGDEFGSDLIVLTMENFSRSSTPSRIGVALGLACKDCCPEDVPVQSLLAAIADVPGALAILRQEMGI